MKSIRPKVRFLIAITAMISFFIALLYDCYFLRIVSKPIPILVFLSLLNFKSHYSKFIFIGLLFSMIGDILLEVSNQLFIMGLISFLIAHINYITAFVGRSKKLNLLPALILLMLGSLLFLLLLPKLHTLMPAVLIYLIVILIMAWRAIAQANFDNYAKYAALGAIIFIISDSLIAIDKFYAPLSHIRWIIMPTYWTAQALIFLSAFKSQKKNKLTI